MNLNNSKWIVCSSTDGGCENWRVLGSIEPQPNSELLHSEIATKYHGHETYGIWIVNDNFVLRSTIAPSKQVTPLSRIFKTNDFIKSYRDLIEGMEFVSNEAPHKTSRVLATREGFCMMAQEAGQPIVMHWKKLVSTHRPK